MYGNARKERAEKRKFSGRGKTEFNRSFSRAGECMVISRKEREKKERGRKRRDRVEQVLRAGECMVMQERREIKKERGRKRRDLLNSPLSNITPLELETLQRAAIEQVFLSLSLSLFGLSLLRSITIHSPAIERPSWSIQGLVRSCFHSLKKGEREKRKRAEEERPS